jgi:hypothetical protein
MGRIRSSSALSMISPDKTHPANQYSFLKFYFLILKDKVIYRALLMKNKQNKTQNKTKKNIKKKTTIRNKQTNN